MSPNDSNMTPIVISSQGFQEMHKIWKFIVLVVRLQISKKENRSCIKTQFNCCKSSPKFKWPQHCFPRLSKNTHNMRTCCLGAYCLQHKYQYLGHFKASFKFYSISSKGPNNASYAFRNTKIYKMRICCLGATISNIKIMGILEVAYPNLI